MRIKCDSREQLPYMFNDGADVPMTTDALLIGDYSVCGAEDQISVERKTLDDLIGCLTTGRERFERELYKGKSLYYMALIIEASLSDIVNHNYRSEMKPKAVIQSLIAFSIRYRLPVWFCETRKYAERITKSLLQKYSKEIQRRHKAIEDG